MVGIVLIPVMGLVAVIAVLDTAVGLLAVPVYAVKDAVARRTCGDS